MITDWYLKCGDCPSLKTEHWRGERIAVRCGSPESPYYPVERVLAVMPDFTRNPGCSTIRPRWCHDKTKGETENEQHNQ